LKTSAGILVYRVVKNVTEVFLVHPGGPFWKNKDIGAWSIPKGEFTSGEDPLSAAQREFEEETGIAINGKFVELSPAKLKSGKIVHAWAIKKDIDASVIKSNTFPLEWPPRSGKMIDVPEVDKAAWFEIAVAKEKINPAQISFIDELLKAIS
jgi:predicted NUDIX family NTP pyrophosphohydrolase